jgi:hypothetical protein
VINMNSWRDIASMRQRTRLQRMCGSQLAAMLVANSPLHSTCKHPRRMALRGASNSLLRLASCCRVSGPGSLHVAVPTQPAAA